MSPIVIIPEEKETITLKTEDFRKYISDAYYSGYNEGYEKGKNENKMPSVTYRGIGSTIPVDCNDTITLFNKEADNELLRGK